MVISGLFVFNATSNWQCVGTYSNLCSILSPLHSVMQHLPSHPLFLFSESNIIELEIHNQHLERKNKMMYTVSHSY